MISEPPEIQPRDVITPSATILTLIITAFGIVVTLANDSQLFIIRNFASVFIAVVILARATSLRGERKTWTPRIAVLR